MVTTIQLSEDVKRELDRLKLAKESYEQVIMKLMNESLERRKEQETLLIEGCKEMYGDMLEMAREWDGALMDGLNKDEKWTEF